MLTARITGRNNHNDSIPNRLLGSLIDDAPRARNILVATE
jgi:hypothetical protein